MTRVFKFNSSVLFAVLTTVISSLAVATDIAVVGLFKDQAVVRFDQGLHTLKVGQTNEAGLVLLAVESSGARIRYKNETRLYPVVRDYSGGYQTRKQAQATLRLNERGQYLSPGSINGQSVNFQLDTGANLVALSATEAQRLGIDYLTGQAGMAETAQGRVNIWVVTLTRVKIGELELSNVPAAIIEGNYPAHVLLGMSFLTRVKIQENQGLITLVQKM